jgi:IS30 family transposase
MYVSKKADMKCYQRRYWVTKPPTKLWQMKYLALWRYAFKHLMKKYPWSPEEIVHRFQLLHPNEPSVSVPTFYAYLYHRRPDLCRKLLSWHEHRKKQGKNKTARELIPNRVWIDERPEEIATKTLPWHWEGDTLWSKKGETDTLVGIREKRSRFLLAKHIPSRSPKNVTKCMRSWRKQYKIKSVTLDNGIEFRAHEEYWFPSFFCHPYSSWEKWQIENGMKMLRKKYPKKSSLHLRTKEALKELQGYLKALNDTPMKCLWWKTPREVLYNLEPPIQWYKKCQ